MKRLKVLPLRPFFPADLAYLRRHLAKSVELLSPAEYTPAALAALAGDADVLLGGAVSEEVLAAATKLKLVQVPWTGVDGLNFALLKRYGARVANSHSNAVPVAELAVTLLLSAMKAVPLHDRRLRDGDWMRPRRDGKGEFRPPALLSGATVGLVGYGAIGRATAKLLGAFGARLLAVASRARKPAPAPLEWLGGPEKLPRLLAASDAVILAAPLTARTRGLLDARKIACMRPGAVFVNVSRGEIVDEGALYEALRAGRLGAAGIDAWTEAPSAESRKPPSKHPFHKLDNVVLSPHRAGFAKDRLPHLAHAVENLNRLAAGKAPRNLVNLDAGY